MVVRIATDVGGTFTDFVSFERDGDRSIIRTAKADTTPPNFESGVLDAINKSGVSLADVATHTHGTTVVINALTERKGAVVGLITTEGFRDVLEIGRGNRPDLFNLDYQKPEPFVPRYLRREVPGRLSYQGNERSPLDLSVLPDIVATFQAEGVTAVAICLIHSWADPSHEQAVAARIRELWPEVSVVASSDITREWREYERTSTAVLSAYVQPPAERYLNRLHEQLHASGYNGPTLVMQSNCGVNSLEATARTPITMVESGPASGFWGAAALGQLIDEPNILALDIGGTTAKCSLIENGRVKILTDYWIERDSRHAGYPMMVPVVDLVEIGNGGGSIAWVDEFGKLRVGPQSAGASPGPAAYGRGGTDATTTDANLWLGRISADDFCGGEVEPDLAATERGLRAIGERLGLDVDEAARGIIRIANNNMFNALKLVSLNRGHDPRDFTMVAFGGGGPMHAVALAEELGVRKVVVPFAASVFSAWGMAMSDVRRDYFLTYLSDTSAEGIAGLADAFTNVEAQARHDFDEAGFAGVEVTFERYGKFRYQNQEHYKEIEVRPGDLTPEGIGDLIERFHVAYQAEYTYRLDANVELVGLHVTAAADIGKPELVAVELGDADASPAKLTSRAVDFAAAGKHETDIYDGSKLEAGMRFSGPAVIESAGTSALIHPGCEVFVDPYRNLHITLPADTHRDSHSSDNRQSDTPERVPVLASGDPA